MNADRFKHKEITDIRQILNSTAIGGEKIAKEGNTQSIHLSPLLNRVSPPAKPRKKIGFVVKEKKAAYGKSTKGSRRKK
jgi:hypothetical protein